MKFLRFFTLLLAGSIICLSCKENKQVTQQKEKVADSLPVLSEGSFEARDSAFFELVPKNAVLEILAEGHEWTEGPLWLPEQQELLYCDIPRNTIYAWKEGSGKHVYLTPSGFTGTDFQGSEPGSNGLILNANNQLILCQHGDRRIAKMDGPLTDPQAAFTTVADRYEGKRFNSPNDLVFTSNGTLYFTDPPYGLPKQMEDPEKELLFQGIYALDPEGKLTLIDKKLTRPNGIAFSPDERVLYVANSDPEKAVWKHYPVSEDGVIGKGQLFFDATEMVPNNKGLPDGLKVHNSGTLFATGPGGVLVFAPSGKLLGTIRTEQATSNCAFNEDQSVLYITADSYVLRLRLN